MNFKSLGLNDQLLKNIEALGFEKPTEVQKEAIPLGLEGKDLIVMAKTGSGKTAAFGLPILQKVSHKTEAIILTPTRELAIQVNKDLRVLGNVKTAVVYGQHSMRQEIETLKKSPALIIGTPGRLLHHIKERNIKTQAIKYLVLDEADRMFDMGFIDQMRNIIKRLPKERQTMMFSATMPDAIKSLSKQYMNEPTVIEISTDTKTVDSIEQGYYRVEANEKRKQLNIILKAKRPKSCMIFCNTRVEVDRLHHFLEKKYVCEALHGANSQGKRNRTIEAFKKGELQLLIATDVAARGIHVDDLSMVINYDVPFDKDNYIHRIGRTGRAGSGGVAVTMVTSDEIMNLYEIEEHVNAAIEELDLPDEEMAIEDPLQEHWDQLRKKRNERKNQNDRKKQTHRKNSSKGKHKHSQKPSQRKHTPQKHAKPYKPEYKKDAVKYNKQEVKRKDHSLDQSKQDVKIVAKSKPDVNVVKQKENSVKKKKFSLKRLFKK